jgi:chromosome partitioning protein
VSDADDFRTRATEIFRQLRIGAGQQEDPTDRTDDAGTSQAKPGAGSNEDTLVEDDTPLEGGAANEDDTMSQEDSMPGEGAAPEEVTASENGSMYDEEHEQVESRIPAAGHEGNPEPAAEALEASQLRNLDDAPSLADPADTDEPTTGDLPGPSNEDLKAFLEEDSTPPATDYAGRPFSSPSARGGVVDEEVPRADPLADLEIKEADEPVPNSRAHPGSKHPLPRLLAIANQKGGVGKTTTAVNLGAALAELGYRVLVTDLDPQGNATTGLGINARNLDASIYDVLLHDTPIEDVIEPTTLRNLFVVPATIDLAGAEIELVPMFSRELRLRRALETVREDFDFVLIDCPPSLGLLTVNGLAAATEVVVPIQCEYYALEGLGQLLRNVNLVEGNLNNGLDLSTIILTMYDARTRLAEQVVNDVRKHFGSRVCRSVVPRTVRLSEAPSFGQPIILFDSSSRGAIAYRELAKEVSGVAS